MKGLLIQEFKTLFKSPAAISILIIPVVLMIGLGYLLPSGWIVPSAVTIGIVGSVLLYFGGSLEEIKRTSFMKSMSLTRLNKFSFLSTKILFSVFVSMVSVLWVLFFAWLFTDPIPFLANNFSHLIPSEYGSLSESIAGIQAGEETANAMDVIVYLPFDISWGNIKWVSMLYAGVITIVVSISIAFVFVAFSKSSLSFYLMSFGYLLAMILFGGVVMPSFLIDKDTNGWFTYLYYVVPNYYTNNVMAESFSGGLLPSLLTSIKEILGDGIGIIFDNTGHIIWNKIDGIGPLIDQSIIDGASQADKDLVNEFLTVTYPNLSFSYDNITDAYNAYNSYNGNSEYIDAVYGLLGKPIETFGSWEKLLSSDLNNIFTNIIDGKIPEFSLDKSTIIEWLHHNVFDGLGPIQWSTVKVTLNAILPDLINQDNVEQIISSLLGNGISTYLINGGGIISVIINKLDLSDAPLLQSIFNTLDSSVSNILYNASIEGNVISGILKPFVDNNIVPIIMPIITQLLDMIGSHMDEILNEILTLISNFLETNKPGIYEQFNGMYNVAHWWDYAVPWIETLLLLLVSIKFFKWS